MDSALVNKANAIITQFWTYLFASRPSMKYSNGAAASISNGLVLGVGGGTLAFFLSAAGAYQVGGAIIEQVEVSYTSIL